MGVQDRDWYWEHKRQQELDAERKAAAGREVLERAFSKPPDPTREWHPLLRFILFVAMCGGSYLLLRAVAFFLKT